MRGRRLGGRLSARGKWTRCPRKVVRRRAAPNEGRNSPPRVVTSSRLPRKPLCFRARCIEVGWRMGGATQRRDRRRLRCSGDRWGGRRRRRCVARAGRHRAHDLTKSSPTSAHRRRLCRTRRVRWTLREASVTRARRRKPRPSTQVAPLPPLRSSSVSAAPRRVEALAASRIRTRRRLRGVRRGGVRAVMMMIWWYEGRGPRSLILVCWTWRCVVYVAHKDTLCVHT
ncbi:hypothetical protein T484DRAFT_1967617 [Baffinella frigidus]|nr:hypothetical protein T484DRAFT_1967617 [Cryptophyta sp. CCMP2293]